MNVLLILKALWQRKAFIAYMCLLGAAAALCFRTFGVKNTYTYAADYYITNSELSKLLVDVDTINTDVQMTRSCKILLKSELALDTVGEMLLKKYGAEYLSNYFQIEQDTDGAAVSYDDLYNCISVDSVDEDTAVLEITVNSENPYIAQDIGQFLSYCAPYLIYFYVGSDYISPYENARLYVNEGLPGTKKIVAFGAGFAFILAIVFVIAFFLLSGRYITDSKDIKKTSGLIVLGSIPYYKMQDTDKDGIIEV
ncbi:MAG: hypothetical protein LUC92_02915 [Clostridiales bacterium]|nr:hypothetical protein [Clostridiales bacterium]